MAALPTDPEHWDLLSPERMLRALPERERETFWRSTGSRLMKHATRLAGRSCNGFLRLWAFRAIAVAQPGYYEAREAARNGTGGGMLLEDAIRLHRAGQ
jgi:hypothetical protein